MSNRESGNLGQNWFPVGTQQKDANHKEDMIQSFRNDVFKANDDVIKKLFPPGSLIDSFQGNGVAGIAIL